MDPTVAVILVTIGLFVLAGLYGAFGLIAATCLVKRWTWLYTLWLPEQVRNLRRELIASDVEAECIDLGYAPKERATRLLVRMFCGIPADVIWSGGAWFRAEVEFRSQWAYDIAFQLGHAAGTLVGEIERWFG